MALSLAVVAGLCGVGHAGNVTVGGGAGNTASKANTWTQEQTHEAPITFDLVGIATVARLNPGPDQGPYGRSIRYARGHVFKVLNGSWQTPGNYHMYAFDVRIATAPRVAAVLTSYDGFDFNPITLDAQGNYLYVVGFSTMGLDNANTKSFAVVDITTPGSPRVITDARCMLPFQPYAIKCQGDYCYVGFDNASGTNTFRIVDISSPTKPVTISGSTLNLPAHVNGLDVRDNLVYLTFENGAPNSFRIVDITDPRNPRIVNSVQSVGSEPREVVVQDGYAYTGSYFETSGVMVVNVSTPGNPTSIGGLATPNPVICNYLFGKWLCVGMQNFYADGKTFNIYDISDRANLKLAAEFKIDTNVHGIDGQGEYIYIGGYGSYQGLYVLKVHAVDAPAIVGGNVKAGNLLVVNEAVMEKSLEVGGAVRVGGSGLHVDGPGTFQGMVTLWGPGFRLPSESLVGLSTPVVVNNFRLSAGNGLIYSTGTANAWQWRRTDGLVLSGD